MYFAIAIALLFFPTMAFGYEAIKGDTVVITKDQAVDGNLYVAGQNLTIDKDIDGDVFCAGQSVTINGNVEGSVFCAGQTVIINGNVKESVRTAGNTITINKEVGKNVMAFGAAVNLGQDAKIGWDLLIGAGSAVVRGDIGRSIHGGGSNVLIDGIVGKDVKLDLSNDTTNSKEMGSSGLKIGKNAQIRGNVDYKSKKQIEVAEGAQIGGEVKKGEIALNNADRKEKGFGGYVAVSFYSFLAALVTSIILIALFASVIKNVTSVMLENIGASIGWGLIAFILTPLVVLLLLVTLIGVPVALMLFVLWLVFVYVSKILVGILIGRAILNRKDVAQEKSLYLCALVGIAIAWIIFSIPVIGWMLSLIAIFWGLGGIWLTLKKVIIR